MTRVCPVLFLVVLFLPGVLAAQSPLTVHTVGLDDTASLVRASLGDVAWIEGSWTGRGLGGVVDEVWIAPAGGAMLGMFRLTVNDTVRFYELMTVQEESGSLLLRIKHFGGDLSGWEEKDEMQTARLVGFGEGQALFEGITFRQPGADRLEVFVAMHQKDGTFSELRFDYARMQR
jgi:hypothetical protein